MNIELVTIESPVQCSINYRAPWLSLHEKTGTFKTRMVLVANEILTAEDVVKMLASDNEALCEAVVNHMVRNA